MQRTPRLRSPLGWGQDPAPSGQKPQQKRGFAPAQLLPALKASHGAAAGPRAPATGTGAGVAFVSQGCGDKDGLACPPRQDRGPQQLGQGQAQACAAMARTQSHRPLRRGRGQPRPSPQSPAGGLCRGGPLRPRGCHPCRQQAHGWGQPPAPARGAPQGFSAPMGQGWGCPPSLGARVWRSPKQQRARCSGEAGTRCQGPSARLPASPEQQPARLEPSAPSSSSCGIFPCFSPPGRRRRRKRRKRTRRKRRRRRRKRGREEEEEEEVSTATVTSADAISPGMGMRRAGGLLESLSTSQTSRAPAWGGQGVPPPLATGPGGRGPA